MTHRGGLPSLICALVLLGAPARAERLVSDGMEVPPTSVAIEQSTTALFVNPAGIGLSSTSFAYLHEDGRSGFPDARRSDAIVARLGGQVLGGQSALGLSFGIEWIRPRGVACTATAPCSRRTSLGLSAGTSTASLGVAWRSFASAQDAELDALDTFDAGLVVRPASWLSLGATANTINAPTIASVRQPRRYALGAGVRPLGSRLTLAADTSVDDDEGFEAVTLRAVGLLTVVEGVDLLAEVRPTRRAAGGWDTDLQFGLAFGLGHGSVKAAATKPASGSLFDSSVFMGELTSARGPAIGGVPEEAHVINVAQTIAPPRGLVSLLLQSTDALDPYTRLVLQLQRLSPETGARVVVLVLKDDMGLSFGRIEELRGLVRTLQSRGTRVIAWMSGADDATYYLATACDRILAMPQSMLEINGLASNRFYLAGLLEKLGVNAEFVKIGRFKSAPEQFTNRQASESSAEEINAILDDQSARYVAAISHARNLSDGQVRKLLDAGAWLSEEALDNGLVDAVVTPGPGLDEQTALVAGRRLNQRRAGPDEQVPATWGSQPAIAVVEITGSIVSGSGLPGEKGSASEIVKNLGQAARDPGVKAIVLRVDSPGGEVTASELIWAAVEDAKKRKPVVASFGDVAASGGYYVAAGADAIFAEPGTLTGSIGVFAGKVDLSELLAKLGITTQSFTRGERANLLSPTQPWTDGERARVEKMVEGFYESFLQRVAIGRKMSRDEVDAVAQGRVWTGAQAHERGLVDELGGLEQALAEARRRAKISADAPVRIFGQTGLYSLPDALTARPSESLEPLFDVLSRLLIGHPMKAPKLIGGDSWARAAPVLEALRMGRPLALAVDLPDVR